jgi:archaemetzincin
MISLTSVSDLTIVPIGEVDPDLLEYLGLVLPATFAARGRMVSIKIDPADAYNSARRQYHSTHLLQKVRDFAISGSGKVLGITEVDLFIPIFTFVFGEAQVGGPAALMSAHRLRQEFYGLPEDRNLLFGRAEKEATHELGHAYGLAHCRSYDCVMRFSNSVEDVDVKANEFCPSCSDKLRARCDSSLAA